MIDHLKKVIVAAGLLKVPVVGTFIGKDKDKTVPANLDEYARVWPPIVSFAASQGVKIAIENCPMLFSYDEWPGGNNLAVHPGHLAARCGRSSPTPTLASTWTHRTWSCR